MNISFIILAYNDAPSLKNLTQQVNQVLSEIAVDFEIILVDDGSKDNTPQTIREIQSAFSKVRSFRHERNQGVGACFKTGYQNAKFEIIGYTDGDHQYEPSDLKNMISFFNQYDAVSGIRVRRKDNFKRKVISFFYQTTINILYGTKFKDVNSGLKIYKKNFMPSPDEIISNGPFYDAEILIRGMRNGGRLVEIPINHYERKFGIPGGGSFKSIFKTFHDMQSNDMLGFRSKSPQSFLLQSLLKFTPKHA